MTTTQRKKDPFTADSWLMTFGDLLGILLALFVLIYAVTDRQSENFNRAVISLATGLRDAAGRGNDAVFATLQAPFGYQTALLERNLEATPQWSLQADLPRRVTLTLEHWALEETLGDGLWLEGLERFEKPVWMRIAVPRKEDIPSATRSVTALEKMRRSLGLSQPWGIEITQDGRLRETVVTIHVGLDGETPGYKAYAPPLRDKS
ncbi:MAG: flagellar motor protein MotB [Pseudomonadota bacterium]